MGRADVDKQTLRVKDDAVEPHGWVYASLRSISALVSGG